MKIKLKLQIRYLFGRWEWVAHISTDGGQSFESQMIGGAAFLTPRGAIGRVRRHLNIGGCDE